LAQALDLLGAALFGVIVGLKTVGSRRNDGFTCHGILPNIHRSKLATSSALERSIQDVVLLGNPTNLSADLCNAAAITSFRTLAARFAPWERI